MNPLKRLLVLAWLAASLASGYAAEPDFAALARLLPGGGDLTIPTTLYSDAVRQEEKARLLGSPSLWQSIQERADRYAAIPLADWDALIPDRSAAPLNDELVPGTSQYQTDKRCILCGAVPGGKYEGWDLIDSPYTLTTSCCRQTIHERAADRTPDDAPIIGQHEIQHYDGRVRALDYSASQGLFHADGSPANWYPANIVWAHRLSRILGDWRGGVVPDLRDAYLATGDDRYARSLATVLQRLATVFPAWPLGYHNGIAPIDHAELVAAAAEHRPLGAHSWLGPCRMVAYGSNFRPPMEGFVSYLLVSGYMAIEAAPVWGDDPAAADAAHLAVRRGLFDELKLVIDAYGANQTMGNGIGMYAPGLLAMGILYQDPYLYGGVLALMEEFLYNENYYDGLSTEGSTNYAGMVGGMAGLFKTAGLTASPAYLALHPLLARLGSTQSRLTTLRGLMSAHGDGPNSSFGLRQEPTNTIAGSEIMGGYGISVLRAGPLEHRTELLLQHDRAIGHAHDNQLGIQLFYRGMPLLQYLGDSRLNRFVDLRDDKNPHAAALKALDFPAPMVESDMARTSFSMELPCSPYTKNTLVIDDYSHNGAGRAPWRGGYGTPDFPTADLIAATSNATLADGVSLQFVEAEGRNLLRHHVQGVQLLRRSLLLVTRPDGRSYTVDIMRAAGGNRHLMLYMSRGTEVDSTWAANGVTYPTQQAWLDATAPDRLEWMPHVLDAVGDRTLLHDIAMATIPAAVWRHTWRLDMAAWAPRTATPFDREWMDALPPAYLRVHGIRPPGAHYSDVFRATANYPASIDETLGDGENDRLRGMVEFKDALHFIGTQQRSGQRLVSTQVHVLEPWAEGEEPIIASISWLPADTAAPGHVGLRISFTDGSHDTLLYTPPTITTATYTKDPELAALPPLNGRVVLLRTYPPAPDQDGAAPTVTLIPHPLAGTLLDLRGDITGDRRQSVLVVQPDGEWPSGKGLQDLTGLAVSVGFNGNQRLETYEIASAERLENGSLQLTLAGAPPLIDHFGKVLKVGPDGKEARDPQTAGSFIGTSTAKGGGFYSTYHHGSRLIFPTKGLAYAVKGGEERVQGGARYDLAEQVDLNAAGVEAETPFILAPDWAGARVYVHHRATQP